MFVGCTACTIAEGYEFGEVKKKLQRVNACTEGEGLKNKARKLRALFFLSRKFLYSFIAAMAAA